MYIRPRTPRLNGKVERSHRVDEQEFYQLLDKDGIADDIHLFNDKLREWEDYYNYHRPHGALDGQTPYERLLAKKDLCQRVTEVLRPYRLLAEIHDAYVVVSQKGAPEAAGFRDLVMKVAQSTAEAAKEGGFLGIGGTQVSAAEQGAIDKIRTALN